MNERFFSEAFLHEDRNFSHSEETADRARELDGRTDYGSPQGLENWKRNLLMHVHPFARSFLMRILQGEIREKLLAELEADGINLAQMAEDLEQGAAELAAQDTALQEIDALQKQKEEHLDIWERALKRETEALHAQRAQLEGEQIQHMAELALMRNLPPEEKDRFLRECKEALRLLIRATKQLRIDLSLNDDGNPVLEGDDKFTGGKVIAAMNKKDRSPQNPRGGGKKKGKKRRKKR